MGISNHLYLGPLAAWNRPAGEDTGRFGETPLGLALVEGGILHWQHHLGDVPRVGHVGTITHQYVFMPRQDRPGRPGREVYYSGKGCLGLGVRDLTDADPRAEIAWYADTFRDELRLLADHFGAEPELRWGLVEWLT